MSEPWTPADGRRAPATLRNRDAIADVLARVLPTEGSVLEIASGSGEHAAFLGSRFPALDWQPSDPDPAALASIAAWTAGVANVRPPVALDVRRPWPVAAADVVLCVNMLHIAPWEATWSLFAGAAGVLPVRGTLVIYGPFVQDGVDTAPSNLAFDRSLKERNAEWGLRRLDAVIAVAQGAGFSPPATVEMPANNLTLIFRRA